MSTSRPWLSLVIGSRNEGDHLERTLTGAFGLDPPEGGLEASVLDDASSDGSSLFCDRDPWLQRRQEGTLRLQRVSSCLGVSGGRRQASLGCRGEVLVFLDAHLDFPRAISGCSCRIASEIPPATCWPSTATTPATVRQRRDAFTRVNGSAIGHRRGCRCRLSRWSTLRCRTSMGASLRSAAMFMGGWGISRLPGGMGP
jgi:glycosyltransferase involved in cell wall biosynthesis